MKNKFKEYLMLICLFLNMFLIIMVISLNNDIKNMKEKNDKINENIERQNEIVAKIQQEYDTLKFQFDVIK